MRLLFTLLLVFINTIVFADQVKFGWIPNTDGVTIGYSVVMDDGDNIVSDVRGIESNQVVYDIEDNDCHTFSIYAYNEAGEFSKLGNMIYVCPELIVTLNLVIKSMEN